MLLNRRDRVYPLSLLIPFTVYNLALKAYDVTSRPEKHGLGRTLKLMRSDVFFNLGYALLWIGLFGVVRRGPLRRVMVFLFHVTTMLAAIVRASAHEYFRETGTALDYDIVALWLPRPKDVKQMITLPPRARVLLAVALFYWTLGPWIVSRALGRLRGWPAGAPDEMPRRASFFLGPLGLILQALGFGSLSLLTGPGTPGAGKSFARDPFVNLIVTGVKAAMTKEDTGAAHGALGGTTDEVGWTTRRRVDDSGRIFETTYNRNGEIAGEEAVGDVADLPVEAEYLDEEGRFRSLANDELGNTFEWVVDDEFNTIGARLVRGTD